MTMDEGEKYTHDEKIEEITCGSPFIEGRNADTIQSLVPNCWFKQKEKRV